MGNTQTFTEEKSDVAADERGGIAHRSLHEHTERLAPQIYEVTPEVWCVVCLLYTSPSPRDMRRSRMPSSA